MTHARIPPWSERQTIIATHIAAGLTTAEIAVELSISQRTVEDHAARVRNKIVLTYPEIRFGRPRPVILRYFKMVESRAFHV